MAATPDHKVKPAPKPRETGYYYIRPKEKWTVGYWNEEFWKIIGSTKSYQDTDFTEIYETTRLRYT